MSMSMYIAIVVLRLRLFSKPIPPQKTPSEAEEQSMPQFAARFLADHRNGEGEIHFPRHDDRTNGDGLEQSSWSTGPEIYNTSVL